MNDTTVKTEGAVLTIERMFNAPREKVWAAWTTKELFEKWWGPKGWSTTVKHMDFVLGGYLHYGMRCDDPAQGEWYGKYSWGKSVYESIDEPNGFSYIDYFCDENCEINQEMPAVRIHMSFVAVGVQTKVVCRSDMKSEETLKQLMDMGMIEGLTQTWDRLEVLVGEK